MALFNKDNYGVESKETNLFDEKMTTVSTPVLDGLSHNITAQLESCVIKHTDLYIFIKLIVATALINGSLVLNPFE